jgi:hypothetical protein
MRFRELRWPCDQPIGLRGPAGQMTVRIVNLSTHGARIAAEGLGRGDRIEVQMWSGPITGSVRWVRDGLAGLRFAHPVTPRDMARIRGQQLNTPQRTKWNLTLHELR